MKKKRWKQEQYITFVFLLMASIFLVITIVVLLFLDIGFQPEKEICLEYDRTLITRCRGNIPQEQPDAISNDGTLKLMFECLKLDGKIEHELKEKGSCLDWRDKTEGDKLNELANIFCKEKEQSLDKFWIAKQHTWKRDDGIYYQIDCRISDSEIQAYWAKIGKRFV